MSSLICQKIRLIYLKGALRILAGAKTPTGQTASEKRGILSNLNLKFSALSDKHNTHIMCPLCLSETDQHNPHIMCPLCLSETDQHKRYVRVSTLITDMMRISN
jgi:hypothetical protein